MKKLGMPEEPREAKAAHRGPGGGTEARLSSAFLTTMAGTAPHAHQHSQWILCWTEFSWQYYIKVWITCFCVELKDVQNLFMGRIKSISLET